MKYPAIVVVQPPIAQTESKMLSLPGEIRNEIYHHVFVGQVLDPSDLHFLVTCRQVYLEARGIAYDEVPVLVDTSKVSVLIERASYPGKRQVAECLEDCVVLHYAPAGPPMRRSMDMFINHSPKDIIELWYTPPWMPEVMTLRHALMGPYYRWRGNFFDCQNIVQDELTLSSTYMSSAAERPYWNHLVSVGRKGKSQLAFVLRLPESAYGDETIQQLIHDALKNTWALKTGVALSDQLDKVDVVDRGTIYEIDYAITIKFYKD